MNRLPAFLRKALLAMEEAETLCLEKDTDISEAFRDLVYKIHDDIESLLEDVEKP